MTPTWEGFRNATEGAIASHPTDLNFEDVLLKHSVYQTGLSGSRMSFLEYFLIIGNMMNS